MRRAKLRKAIVSLDGRVHATKSILAAYSAKYWHRRIGFAVFHQDLGKIMGGFGIHYMSNTPAS